MPFKPGHSGNPRGRPPRGALTKLKLHEQAERAAQGELDSLVVLSRVASSDEVDLPLRVTAAGLLAPYQHARVTKRKISKPIDLPESTTVEMATAAIAKIASLAAAGELALDEANDLINHQKAFIESKVGSDLEAQVAILKDTLEKLGEGAVPFGITILDGLPVLPGTNIEMPRLARPPLEHSPNGGDGTPEPDRGPEGAGS
jgi:hypothetical protein